MVPSSDWIQNPSRAAQAAELRFVSLIMNLAMSLALTHLAELDIVGEHCFDNKSVIWICGLGVSLVA